MRLHFETRGPSILRVFPMPQEPDGVKNQGNVVVLSADGRTLVTSSLESSKASVVRVYRRSTNGSPFTMDTTLPALATENTCYFNLQPNEKIPKIESLAISDDASVIALGIPTWCQDRGR